MLEWVEVQALGGRVDDLAKSTQMKSSSVSRWQMGLDLPSLAAGEPHS